MSFNSKVALRYKTSQDLQSLWRRMSPDIDTDLEVSGKPTQEGFQTFEVGKYTVYLDWGLDSFKTSCTCPFWVFGGCEHHAMSGGYLYGDLRGNGKDPLERDPQGHHLLCKHTASVLKGFL